MGMTDTSAPFISSPEYFLPIFIVAWMGISVLLAFMSGWTRLAEDFRAEDEIEGDSARFASGSMGGKWLPVNYGNCLFVTFGQKGFRLSILFLFRFMSPPLFIPWTEVESVTERRILYFFRQQVVVLRRHSVRIAFTGGSGAKLKKAYEMHLGNTGAGNSGERTRAG